jgi:hypothetical protein
MLGRCGLEVELVRGGGVLRREVEDDARGCGRRCSADGLHAQPVSHQEVVRRRERRRRVAPPGRVRPDPVPVIGDDPRFVEGGDAADAAAQPRRDDPGVLGEGLGGGADRPPAGVLERLTNGAMSRASSSSTSRS